MKNNTNKFGQQSSKHNSHDTTNTTIDTSIALTQEEIESLVFMYQEEKLAMDVYDYFYDMYDMKIFDKISDSEYSHLTAVENILNAYEIDTSNLTSLEAGVYENETLQDMYTQLIQQGSTSLEDALNVGVAIEVLDMEDLDSQLNNDYLNENIAAVYENLEAGSVKHLEAFEKTLGDDLFIA